MSWPSTWTWTARPTAQDSDLVGTDCTVESDGFVYRHSGLMHGYQVQVGDLAVVVAGSAAVDHQLLRNAALTLHLATAEDLGGNYEPGKYYVGDAPGYTGRVLGMPTGMIYEPTDHASGLRGVFISLQAEYGGSRDVCFQVHCEPEGNGLTYLRREDGTHAYVMRHGDINVVVTGGSLVDRSVLRQVALDSRPASDDELLRALKPPKATSLLGQLRRWLRDHT
jgi:hypothetical protein